MGICWGSAVAGIEGGSERDGTASVERTEDLWVVKAGGGREPKVLSKDMPEKKGKEIRGNRATECCCKVKRREAVLNAGVSCEPLEECHERHHMV